MAPGPDRDRRQAGGGPTVSPGAPEPLPTRQRQREQTRSLIFHVAMQEISEVGLAKARIEHIARKAGVTRPTFYAHFPSKEDLLRELQARTEQVTLEALRSRLGDETAAVRSGPTRRARGKATAGKGARKAGATRARKAGGSSQEGVIHRLVDAVFDLVEGADPVLRREAFGLMVREPRARDWVGTALFAYLSAHLAEAQRRGEIGAAVPADDLTRIVMTALFGFIAVEGGAARTRRALAHELAALLMAGAGRRDRRRGGLTRRR